MKKLILLLLAACLLISAAAATTEYTTVYIKTSQSFTVPVGVTSLSSVEILGGGGNGGNGDSSLGYEGFGGSGGAAGQKVTQTNIPVVEGVGYSCIVGGAGSSSSAFGYTATAGSNGVTGGNSPNGYGQNGVSGYVYDGLGGSAGTAANSGANAGGAGGSGYGAGGGGGAGRYSASYPETSGASGNTGIIAITYLNPVIASFTSSTTSGTAPLYVTFTDTSSGYNLNGFTYSFRNTTGNNTVIQFATTQNAAITLGVGTWNISHTATSNSLYTNTSAETTITVVSASSIFGPWSAYGDAWISTNDTYTQLKYNSTGIHTWSATGNATTAYYIIQAAGAGGANGGTGGGGGGAGGVEYGSLSGLSGSQSIDVGAGGLGGAADPSANNNGQKGGNSSFATVTANGGGYGGAYITNGGDGGSGGGGGGSYSAGSSYAGGSSVPSGEGNAGGTTPAGSYGGSGGGGKGSAGSAASGLSPNSNGGNGGTGTNIYSTLFNITENSGYLAAGGGGGVINELGSAGTGGSSIGGNGGKGVDGTNAVANTGSGGGGGGREAGTLNHAGGNGGSGLVILKYLTPTPPTAYFTYNVSSGATPLTVQFTDLSSNTPTSWSWAANNVTGNNTPFVFSTSQNPLYVLGIGNWSINLTATNAYGSNTSAQTAFINVTPILPIASFTHAGVSGSQDLSVQFTDTSTSPSAYTSNWSFGDGNISTTTSPLHTYPMAVSYLANLTIQETSSGYYSTSLQTVTINQTVSANFIGMPTSGGVPLVVTFMDTSSGTGLNSWSWNFGDGNTSAVQNPTHTYVTVGSYSVSLTVIGPDGSSSITKPNYIASSFLPQSEFSANNTAPIAFEQPVLFTVNTSGTADRYLYNFGDGSTDLSTDGIATHMYTMSGAKTVSLTAYESVNTSITNTTTRISYINPVYNASLVLANFTGSPTSGSVGVNVVFTDESIFGTSNALSGRSYNWSFGDGTYSSIVGSTNHVYGYYGTYPVTLLVNNTINSSSLTRTNYITVSTQTTNLVYSAQLYRFVFQNLAGTPLGGLKVDITPLNLTTNSDWITQLQGISPQVNIVNGVISGTTATDGTLGTPLITNLWYSIHIYGTATSGDVVDYTITEYPPSTGTDIMVYLPTSITGFITIKPTPSFITYNVYNQSISNTTDVLSVNYYDPTCATNITIVTVTNQSGYVLNQTTYTGTAACNVVNNLTYVQGVTSPPGDIVQYGFSAYVSTAGGWNNITETVGFNHGSSITGNATYDSWLAIILIVLVSSAFTASTVYIGTIGVGLMGLFFYLSTKWITPGVAGTVFIGMCVFWICVGAIGLITKRSRSVF